MMRNPVALLVKLLLDLPALMEQVHELGQAVVGLDVLDTQQQLRGEQCGGYDLPMT
jgi:hypothetical protein